MIKQIFVLTLVAVFPVSSQPTYRYDARPSGNGARGTAFADAYSADASDVNSMYSNPASLCFLKTSSISVSHLHDWTYQTFQQNIAAPFQISQGIVAALGVNISTAGYLHPTPLVGDVRFSQYGLDLGYAMKISSTLSLGAVVGIRYGKAENSPLGSTWLTVGAFYSPTPALTYGAVFRGGGTGLSYVFEHGTTTVERQQRLPRTFELGAALSFPATSREPWVNLALASEKSFPDNENRIKGGCEVLPFKFCALRLGYGVGPKTVAARYGVGIKMSWLQLDYSISPSELEEQFDAISLSIHIGNR
jgi:hypothetical protein